MSQLTLGELIIIIPQFVRRFSFTLQSNNQSTSSKKPLVSLLTLHVMISKVRLQRKFNPKSRFNYQQHLMLILRTLIIFELFIILLTCLFNTSLDFHLDQIFTCQFWTNRQVKHYNLAILVSCFLYCPYLIYIEKISVSLVRDCYFTVLLLHSIFGFVQNQLIQSGYLLFVGIVGYLTATATQYLAIVLEQKKLIEEINQIEAEDRKQIKFQDSQFASLTSFQLSDSK